MVETSDEHTGKSQMRNAIKFVIGSLIGAGLAIAIVEASDGQSVDSDYNGKAVYDTAFREFGVFKPEGGDKLRVRQYVEETDQDSAEYTGDGWCSAFVSWCLKQNGYQYSSDNNAAGWSYFSRVIEIPKIGDIVIIAHHIAFYAGEQPTPNGEKTILLLGGNQAGQVCMMGVPESLVIHYLEPLKAAPGWVPTKKIVNKAFAAGWDNVLDDRSNQKVQMNSFFPNGQQY